MVDQLTEISLPGRAPAEWSAPIGRVQTNGTPPTFVAGPENRLVAAAWKRLLKAADSPVADRAGPGMLALFGSSGTGKTLLISGLVRYWQVRRGEGAAAYITASEFRRRYIAALRDDTIGRFRSDFRERELLAIDDLHQLPRDGYLLRELRYTLDEYGENGGTVVTASNRPASTLANLTSDLRSRFAAGLTLQLAPPGSEARLRILRRASAALECSLSDVVIERIAAGVTGTASDLIGALYKLCAEPRGTTVADADRADELLPDRRLPLREIVAVVARYSRVPQKQLRGSSRRQSIVFARSLAVYLARELAQASYHEIGRALGGRDHTTIMHNYRKIDDERRLSPATQEAIDELRRILLSP